MRHSINLTCARYRLRPVTLEDAAFIVALRTDPLLNRFVHETSPRLQDQVEWLERYFERAGDYYFIVEDARSNEPHGTIGLYDVTPDFCEGLFGRWIIKGSPIAALESAWLIYEAGFLLLKLQSVYTLTLAQNQSVVSFHGSFGARRVRLIEDRYTVRGELHAAIEHRLTAAEWPNIRARHHSTIARVIRGNPGPDAHRPRQLQSH